MKRCRERLKNWLTEANPQPGLHPIFLAGSPNLVIMVSY